MIAGAKKKLIKFVLLVCNGLLAIVGLGLFVLTLVIRYENGARAFAAKKLGDHLDELQTDMTVLAVIGFLMFVVGASAVVGVGFENRVTLRLFVVLIILIGLTQLGYAIGVICTKAKIRNRVYRDMTVYVINYDLHSEEMRSAFDDMQKKGNCCGCYGRGDYRKLYYQVPGSCPASSQVFGVPTEFAPDNERRVFVALGYRYVFQKGCCRVVWQNMKVLGAVFGYMALVLALIQNTAVTLACLLISSIESSRYDVKSASNEKLKVEEKSVPQLERYRELKKDSRLTL